MSKYVRIELTLQLDPTNREEVLQASQELHAGLHPAQSEALLLLLECYREVSKELVPASVIPVHLSR